MTCNFEGCGKPHLAKGWCGGHYRQASRGRELTTLQPVRSQATEPSDWFWSKVDKTETCWIWTGFTDSKGYGQFWIDGKTIPAHRYAFRIEKDEVIDNLEVDHICHNPPCVNPHHLRTATRKQNAENLSGPITTNTSGYRGVSYCKQTSRWGASVTHNGKHHRAGRYDTPEEANDAAIKLRVELFTHSQN